MTHVKQSVNGSTILTDEIVEKATKDHWEAAGYERISWARLVEVEPVTAEQARRQTRAALEAVLPDVVEKCAKVAEERYPYREVAKKTPAIASAAAANIAESIRSLLNKEDNANG